MFRGLAAPVVRFSTPPLLASNAPTLLNVAPPEMVMVLLFVARMTPVAALLMLDVAERPVRLIADVPVAVMVPADALQVTVAPTLSPAAVRPNAWNC